MISLSDTDMQPFNNQPILQVKFEKDMGPICGNSVQKGEHLGSWCFVRESWARCKLFKQINVTERVCVEKYLS